MEYVQLAQNYLIDFINSMGIFGPILACFLISIESIAPMLPLAVFITINFIAFGSILGFFISWFFTILGCMLSFYIFRKGFNKRFNIKIKKHKKVDKLVEKFTNISIPALTVLIAIPFFPACLINVAAGLSNMKVKKFLGSIIIGKSLMVYFWGFIGTNLVESLTHPQILIKIFGLIFIAWIVSKIVDKRFKIE